VADPEQGNAFLQQSLIFIAVRYRLC